MRVPLTGSILHLPITQGHCRSSDKKMSEFRKQDQHETFPPWRRAGSRLLPVHNSGLNHREVKASPALTPGELPEQAGGTEGVPDPPKWQTAPCHKWGTSSPLCSKTHTQTEEYNLGFSSKITPSLDTAFFFSYSCRFRRQKRLMIHPADCRQPNKQAEISPEALSSCKSAWFHQARSLHHRALAQDLKPKPVNENDANYSSPLSNTTLILRKWRKRARSVTVDIVLPYN